MSTSICINLILSKQVPFVKTWEKEKGKTRSPLLFLPKAGWAIQCSICPPQSPQAALPQCWSTGMDGRGTAGRQEQFVSIRAALLRDTALLCLSLQPGGRSRAGCTFGVPWYEGPLVCSSCSLWHSSCGCLSSWCVLGWRNLAPWWVNDIDHLQPVF